jgi:predicted naringenin-chalcone synthase
MDIYMVILTYINNFDTVFKVKQMGKNIVSVGIHCVLSRKLASWVGGSLNRAFHPFVCKFMYYNAPL